MTVEEAVSRTTELSKKRTLTVSDVEAVAKSLYHEGFKDGTLEAWDRACAILQANKPSAR